MIKKLKTDELEPGMYVCGVEKAGSDAPEFFMNNILIRTEKDIADFTRGNHRCVYVDIKDAAPEPVHREEAGKEESDHFGGFQSIEPIDELTEELTEAEPEVYDLSGGEEAGDGGGPDLMGLFETSEELELESAPWPEPFESPAFAEDEAKEVVEDEPVCQENVQASDEPEEAQEPIGTIEEVEPIADLVETLEEEDDTGEPVLEELAVENIDEGPEAYPTFEDPVELESAVEDEETDEPCAEVEAEAPIEEPATVEPLRLVEGEPAREPLCLIEGPPGAEPPQREIQDTISFDEELAQAQKVRTEAESLVRDFMGRVRIDGNIMPGRVNDTVGRMVESVFRNQDALASLSRLKSRDDYTFGHCVNVCILSLAIGRHMALDSAELNRLGVGALLHDIGKMLVPDEILKKPGRLTDAEFGEMQRHTSLGCELLYKTNEIAEDSRLVAMHHHERFDGSGYLDGISGNDIHLFARIGAVADVYDAMTSDRVYQKGMSADVALRRMYKLKGVHFDPTLVDRMIKCLGIYPIGTLVELNTGEVAVVSMPNHSDPLKPKVLMLYDRSKKRLPGPMDVNLGADSDRWIANTRDPGPLAGLIEKLIA